MWGLWYRIGFMKPGKDYVGVGVGAMIFDDEGRLLMLKRGAAAKNERGCWEIPGGGVDFGETLAQAIVREIKEEIGVDIAVEHQLLAIDHLIPEEGQHWVAVPFVARIKKGQTPKIIEPHKHTEMGWFDLDKLPEPLAITTEPNLQSYGHHLKHGKRAR